jgi:hypothetical protein
LVVHGGVSLLVIRCGGGEIGCSWKDTRTSLARHPPLLFFGKLAITMGVVLSLTLFSRSCQMRRLLLYEGSVP